VTALVAALKDGDMVTRRHALGALAKIGTGARAAVPNVVEALQGTDADLRRLALFALEGIGQGDRAAVRALVAVLGNKDAELRLRALGALEQIKPAPEDVLPALKTAVQDPSEAIQEGAIRSLGRLGKAGVPELRALLRRGNATRRGYAVIGLFLAGPEATAAIPDLVEILRDETLQADDRRLADNAKMALKQIGPEAVPALAAALKHKDEGVARRAALLLAEFGPLARPALPALVEALADERKFVDHVQRALRAIGKEAVPALHAALKHKDVRVRRRGLEVLYSFGAANKPILPDLLALANGEDGALRRAALYALWGMGTKAREAGPIFLKALKDRDKAFRLLAIQALESIGIEGTKETVSSLRESLRDSEASVARGVPAVLAKLGKAGLPVLIEALKHPDAEVRLEAVRDLAAFKADARETSELLGRMASAGRRDVRWAAVETLLAIGSDGQAALRDAVPALRADLQDADGSVIGTALKLLARLGPLARQAGPDLLELLDDRDLRFAAAVALARTNPEQAARGLAVLSAAVNSSDERATREATTALRELGPLAGGAVPALMLALDRDETAYDAILTLAAIGPTARPAVPALVERLGDGWDRGLLPLAPLHEALKKIDPEAAHKAGVP
jgi:HEAT repeat protein